MNNKTIPCRQCITLAACKSRLSGHLQDSITNYKERFNADRELVYIYESIEEMNTHFLILDIYEYIQTRCSILDTFMLTCVDSWKKECPDADIFDKKKYHPILRVLSDEKIE